MSEHQIDVYQDVKQEWRWRIKTANGSILADSGEGYKNKADCLHGLYGLFFGSYDDSFLVYYAEWQKAKETGEPVIVEQPAGHVKPNGVDDGPGQSQV